MDDLSKEITLVDTANFELINSVDDTDWILRKTAAENRIYDENDVILPKLENLPLLAQLPLERIRDSFQHVNYVIPGYNQKPTITDPQIKQLGPLENQHRLVKASFSTLLTNLRATQIQTISAELAPGAPELPEWTGPSDTVGFLSQSQMSNLADLILLMTSAVSAGMTTTELLGTLQEHGELSQDTAMGLINVMTTTTCQTVLESQSTDLAELLTFAATPAALENVEKVLSSMTANHHPLPPNYEVHGFQQSNCSLSKQ